MKNLHMRAALGLVVAAVALIPGGPAAATDSTPVADFVGEFADKHMADARVPGMVFVMVDRNGVIVAKALGAADLGDERPMTVDTPLRVGSVSKPVTAALAMELAEAGVVDLDVPVDQYLEADLSDAYGPAGTIRQLLRHRGGYPDAFIGSHHLDADDALDLEAWTRRLPRRSSAPDVVASYTSVGYTVAGAAIAAAAETSFEEIAEKALFEPLGMQRATFRQPAPADVAIGYAWNGDGFEPYPVDVPDMVPGVGLVASGTDIARFMHGLLDEDGPLSSSTRHGLLTPAGPGWGLRAYSTGLTEWRYSDRSVLYHEGNGIGTTNRMMILPDEGVGIFTTVNGETLAGLGDASAQSGFVRDLHQGLLERFFPESSAIGSSPVAAGAGLPTTAVGGTYLPTRIDPDSILRLEGLVSQFAVSEASDGVRFGSTEYAVDPDGVYRAGDAAVVFLEGPDGVVYATRGGTGSYRQAAWWETIGANVAVVGGSLLLLTGGLALGLRRSSRLVRWAMIATGTSVLAFFGILGIALSGAEVMDMFTGLPLPIRLAQLMAAGVVVSTAALVGAILLRGREAGTRALTGGLAVAVAGSAIGLWTAVWSILPLS